jgi:hypothetical protein
MKRNLVLILCLSLILILVGCNSDKKTTKSTQTTNEQNSDDEKKQTNSLTADEARQLILTEDSDYISKVTDNNTRLSYDYKEYRTQDMPVGDAWDIPKEPCYYFSIHHYDNSGEITNNCCDYLVGKDSKNVYAMWNQGNSSVYQIKNNQKVKTFKWLKEGPSYDEWR